MRQDQSIKWQNNPFQSKLLPQEKILWQGKSTRGIVLSEIDFFLIPFSFMWVLGAFFGGVQAYQKEPENLYNLIISIPFICIGTYIMFGRFLRDIQLRHGMTYAVTNKRILINRSEPFEFTSINLNTLTDVQMSRSLFRGTIRFNIVKHWNNIGISMSPSLESIPQFIGIEQPEKVLNMITCMMDVTGLEDELV